MQQTMIRPLLPLSTLLMTKPRLTPLRPAQDFTVDEVEGNYKDEASKAALEGDVDLVFMTRADKPFITRFLFGSEAETVARLVREGGGRVVINDSIV